MTFLGLVHGWLATATSASLTAEGFPPGSVAGVVANTNDRKKPGYVGIQLPDGTPLHGPTGSVGEGHCAFTMALKPSCATPNATPVNLAEAQQFWAAMGNAAVRFGAFAGTVTVPGGAGGHKSHAGIHLGVHNLNPIHAGGVPLTAPPACVAAAHAAEAAGGRPAPNPAPGAAHADPADWEWVHRTLGWVD
jgi:hypothetical protein